MMLYLVETAFDASSIQQRVGANMRLGWAPLGGVSVGMFEGKAFFAQAMTKYEPFSLSPKPSGRGAKKAKGRRASRAAGQPRKQQP